MENNITIFVVDLENRSFCATFSSSEFRKGLRFETPLLDEDKRFLAGLAKGFEGKWIPLFAEHIGVDCIPAKITSVNWTNKIGASRWPGFGTSDSFDVDPT